MSQSLEVDFFFCKHRTSTPLRHTSRMETLADRLLSARNAQKLTQAQLARAAGMSQRAVSQLERGETRKTARMLALAAALNVSPQWLETGRGPREAPVWSELVDLSRLPPNAQRDAQRLFKAVADGSLPPDRFRAAVVALLGDRLDG